MYKREGSIRAVLFDWNYTLAKYVGEDSPAGRVLALLKHHGLNYGESDVEKALSAFRSQPDICGYESLRTRKDFLQFYASILGLLEVTPSRIDELANSFYMEYSRLPAQLYDDSYSTLLALTNKGLSVGIITNNSVAVRGTIELLIGHILSPKHIIISQEIGTHKPCRTIYSLAAARLHTKPGECIYIGDNLKTDAFGSVFNGGYKVGIWIDRACKDTQFNLPWQVRRISSLREVIDFVDGW